MDGYMPQCCRTGFSPLRLCTTARPVSLAAGTSAARQPRYSCFFHRDNTTPPLCQLRCRSVRQPRFKLALLFSGRTETKLNKTRQLNGHCLATVADCAEILIPQRGHGGDGAHMSI